MSTAFVSSSFTVDRGDSVDAMGATLQTSPLRDLATIAYIDIVETKPKATHTTHIDSVHPYAYILILIIVP